MNTSFKSGILPNDWKTAKLIPIYVRAERKVCEL